MIGERSFLFDGQSVEERDERHDRMVGEALGRVQDVGAQVLIESSAETVQDTYTRVVHAVDTLWVPKTSSGPLARDDASADPSDPNHGTSVLTR